MDLLNLFYEKQNNLDTLDNYKNLPAISIKDLDNITFGEIKEETFKRLSKIIIDKKLISNIPKDFFIFNIGDDKVISQFYTSYLMDLLDVLDKDKDYYIEDRGIILYGLNSVLTKIPGYLTFIENKWFIFAYDLGEKQYVSFKINQSTREPIQNTKSPRNSYDLNPFFWISNNEDIGTWNRIDHFEYNLHPLPKA